MIFLQILFCIELFYSLFLVHIFLPVNVLLLNFLPVDLLLLESRRFLPMIFYIWFCLLVLSSHFLPANVLLVGFLLVENHHFLHYMWFFYFWILYLWICTWVCCVCILFFTSDFFAPILVLRGGKSLLFQDHWLASFEVLLHFQACIVLAFHTFRESPQNLLSK